MEKPCLKKAKTNKQTKIQGNQVKQKKKVNKTAQKLKIKIEVIEETETEGNLEMEI